MYLTLTLPLTLSLTIVLLMPQEMVFYKKCLEEAKSGGYEGNVEYSAE